MQPGGEFPLQLAAAARGGDPLAQAPIFDHTQGRNRVDAEAFCEVGPIIDGDADEFECVVVAASL